MIGAGSDNTIYSLALTTPTLCTMRASGSENVSMAASRNFIINSATAILP